MTDFDFDAMDFKNYLVDVPSSSNLRLWKNLLKQIKFIEKNSEMPTVILNVNENLPKDKIEILSGIISFMRLKSMFTSIVIKGEVKKHHCSLLSKADSVITELALNQLHINDIILGDSIMNGSSIINSSFQEYLESKTNNNDNIYTLNNSRFIIAETKYNYKIESLMFAA
jgi:hypothetical protein